MAKLNRDTIKLFQYTLMLYLLFLASMFLLSLAYFCQAEKGINFLLKIASTLILVSFSTAILFAIFNYAKMGKSKLNGKNEGLFLLCFSLIEIIATITAITLGLLEGYFNLVSNSFVLKVVGYLAFPGGFLIEITRNIIFFHKGRGPSLTEISFFILSNYFLWKLYALILVLIVTISSERKAKIKS